MLRNIRRNAVTCSHGSLCRSFKYVLPGQMQQAQKYSLLEVQNQAHWSEDTALYPVGPMSPCFPCRWDATAFRGLPLEQETAASLEHRMADTIKIVALIQKFRCKGHLTAQLDPLKRVAYGPWMADIGISSPWSAPTDMKLDYGIVCR